MSAASPAWQLQLAQAMSGCVSILAKITKTNRLQRDIGIMIGAFFALGACGSDDTLPPGTCPAGQVLRYESAGCGLEAKPVCGSPSQDACFRAVCSCQGATISRCDYAAEPFASFGFCPDAGAADAHEQATEVAHDTAPPIDQSVDRAIDLTPDLAIDVVIDLAPDLAIDLAIDVSEALPLDVGPDSPVDLDVPAVDGSIDAI